MWARSSNVPAGGASGFVADTLVLQLIDCDHEATQ
jgi:hypothetical protein